MVKFSYVVALCATVTLVVAGCSMSSPAEPPRSAVPVSDVKLGGTEPGSLVSATTIPNLDTSLQVGSSKAVRVVYRSTSGIDGKPAEVSGVVFLPAGDPPAGGWPVLAFAHGTSGTQQPCAPSLNGTISGAAQLIAAYLKAGVAVTATDYQGLGVAGVHPYLDNRTAGFNVIDSVRAAHNVSDALSASWVSFGGSQGGGAVWAANEEMPSYAPELTLKGTVALVPAADVSGVADAAAGKTMTRDQFGTYIWLVNQIALDDPGFRLDDYRRGVAKAQWDVLMACEGPKTAERAKILKDLDPADLVPATPQATDVLRAKLEEMSVPHNRGAAPMRVYYAGKDQFIAPARTRSAIERACAMGTSINSTFEPGVGHGDAQASDAVDWLGHRLADKVPPTGCTITPP